MLITAVHGYVFKTYSVIFALKLQHSTTLESDMAASEPAPETISKSRETLDGWVREVIAWHFDPDTGCPFWLNYAKQLSWDPREEIQTYDDFSRFCFFQ